MTNIWCGNDGSFNDDAGDGPADLSGLDEEILVGWQDPFTDWGGNLLQGMGQYGVYTVTDPWEPATFPAAPYPPQDLPPPLESAPAQQPDGPLDTPPSPSAPTLPHFGPPPKGSRRHAPAGGAPSHSRTSARGTMTGFDFPFTDADGNLLTEEHASNEEWPWPMTYGDPVMTGWDTPFTDREGSLLSGPGQYGVFTMEDPYDHSSFSNVDLDSPGLEGDPSYFYTGADADAGQEFGSAMGSMFGSAAGEDSKSWGQAGKDIASSIEQGSESGSWGSAIASIASATAKVAVPVIVKAATKSSSGGSSSSSSSTPSGASSSSTTPSPSSSQVAPRAQDPQHQATRKLMTQMRALAQKYGIPIPPPKRRQVTPGAGASSAQLQQFMQSVAPTQQGAS